MPDTSWCRLGGSRGYIVVRELRWDVGRKGSSWVFLVPVGTEFESSVPRLLTWVFPPDDPYFLKAAAIHDCLLEAGYRHAFADSQWFEAALSDHAPPLRVWVAYFAIRWRRFFIWATKRIF